MTGADVVMYPFSDASAAKSVATDVHVGDEDETNFQRLGRVLTTTYGATDAAQLVSNALNSILGSTLPATFGVSETSTSLALSFTYVHIRVCI